KIGAPAALHHRNLRALALDHRRAFQLNDGLHDARRFKGLLNRRLVSARRRLRRPGLGRADQYFRHEHRGDHYSEQRKTSCHVITYVGQQRALPTTCNESWEMIDCELIEPTPSPPHCEAAIT